MASEGQTTINNTGGGAVFGNLTSNGDINIVHTTIQTRASEINTALFAASYPDMFQQVQHELNQLMPFLGKAVERCPEFKNDDRLFPALNKELQHCQGVLKGLQELQQHYDNLPSQARVTWEHNGRGARSLTEMRAQIKSSMRIFTMLNTEMMKLSEANTSRLLKRWVKEVQDEKKTASVISDLSVGSLSLKEENTWTKIGRELEEIGLEHRAFERNKGFIHEELESAIISGELYGIYDSGSQNQQSSATSSGTKTSRSSPPPTTDALFGNPKSSQTPLSPRVKVQAPSKTQDPSRRSIFSRLVNRVSNNSYSLADAVERRDYELVRERIRQGTDINCRLKDGPAAWLLAARNGDHDIVKIFIDNGVDLLQQKEGFLALQAAALEGHYEVVHLLLDAGVPHEDKDFGMDGPLLSAVQENHENIVRLLLKKGANVNVVGGSGESMLIKATERGHAKMVQLLLQHGAEIDHRDNMKLTVLDISCAACHANIVRVLLSVGANPNTSGFKSNTPLHWAIIHDPKDDNGHKDQLETVRLLLESDAKMAIDDINDQRQTPLLYAIRKGKTEIVKLLLQNGADVKKRTEAGVRPLLLAVDTNDATLVSLVLDRNPALEEVDSSGHSALWKAVQLKNMAIIKLLIENGADINFESKAGTLLEDVVQSGDMATLALLLQHGADPNIINISGEFALMEAISANKGHIVKLLLDSGADPNLLSKALLPETPLIRAVRDNNYSLVKLLLRKNAKVDLHPRGSDSALISACRFGYLQMVDVLLEHGASVNLKRSDGVSALSVITSADLSGNPQSVPITEILLEKGADPNTKTSLGLPVIFNQIEQDKNRETFTMDILRLLLSRGADPNSRTDSDTSLLQAIIDSGDTSLVELIIEQGADVNAKGQDGYTSLMHSIESGDVRMLQLLLNRGAKLDPETESSHRFRGYFTAHGIDVKWSTEPAYYTTSTADQGSISGWRKTAGKA
ncbi:hypothetical protein N7456_003082 [Penicillium angulare]|uniref:Peptidase A2 domain-containing protein n=1 Tax=Penicillium angulare TaxID=116970 RepID=A0A9W9FU59_9EURO|nr:hypothetical protein N7456_003082 [Penicillium angulare]